MWGFDGAPIAGINFELSPFDASLFFILIYLLLPFIIQAESTTELTTCLWTLASRETTTMANLNIWWCFFLQQANHHNRLYQWMKINAEASSLMSTTATPPLEAEIYWSQ